MKKILNLRFEIITLLSSSIFYIVFCNILMVELPHLTWFDQFPLVEKFYNGSLTFFNLFTRYGEHGLFGNNLLFLLNVAVFKLSTMFDVYLNDINVIIVGIISILFMSKTIENHKSFRYFFGIITASIFAFSAIQMSSGAMETQVRLGILFFVIATPFIDRLLREDLLTYKGLIISILLIVLSINVFGTLYSFAVIPTISLIIFITLLYKKKLIKNHAILIATYISTTVIYLLQYQLIGGNKGIESGSIFSAVLTMMSNPINFLQSIFAYNASSLFGFASYIDKHISSGRYLMIGFIVTCIYIYSIIRYIKGKQYQKTYLPILFMGYSFFVLALTMLGRPNNWDWYINNWYTVHTKLGAIGCVWILAGDTDTSSFKILLKFINRKVISVTCIVLLFICAIFGNYYELLRAPNERNYYLEKQKYLFITDASQMPVDESGNTPLLHNLDMTMKSIALLKEYNLSVYRNLNSYTNIHNAILGDGWYNFESNKSIWMSGEAEINMYSGEKGILHLKGYLPDTLIPNKISIYINGEKTYEQEVTNQQIDLTVSTAKLQFVKIQIIMEKSFIPKEIGQGEDTRQLGLYVSDLYFE